MLGSFRLLLYLCLLFVCFSLVSEAFAQQIPFNVTVTPQFFDITTTPGKILTEKVRLRNNNDSPTTYTLSIQKVIADSNGNVSVRDFQQGEDEKSWISISSATVSAQPKEWTDIPLTITIPKDATFEHDLALFISTTSPKKQTNGTQITGSIVIPLLITVQKNGAHIDGKLENFLTNAGWYEYLPVTFSTVFLNRGNVHTQPRGNIFITDWTGRQVATLDINAGQGEVLPNAKRIFTTDWNSGFITYDTKMEDGKPIIDKNGNPQKELKLHFDHVLDFRIGKYTATALLVISGEKRDYSFEQTTSFFVFPWKIVLGILVFVLLAGIGLANTIKSIFMGIRKLFIKHE